MLVTLHRPPTSTRRSGCGRSWPHSPSSAGTRAVLFPIHPRTRARLAGWPAGAPRGAGVGCLEPLGYLDFLSLESGAGVIVTDSGGVQEEAAALGVPCYTLRPNTERPITIVQGTNTLDRRRPGS